MNNLQTNTDNLLFRLILLTKRWRQIVDQQLQSSGLTDATWRPLLHLLLLGNGIRQKDLAASVGISGPSLVRLLDALIAKDLILRKENPQDRRAKHLYLTASGKQLATQLQSEIHTIDAQLLKGFSPPELTQLLMLTLKLENNMATISKEQSP